ncbi:MAG: BLUF domain-containing protein [Candidatus Omnitrophica bacterium]|nr:BLUF domain-containing protein [Candidatus Omnitrophota bacterium]
MLHQLFYVSVETHELSEQDIEELLQKSRQKNTALGITGILIYYKRHFLQILEGEKEDVFKLYFTIKADQRHASVILVFDQPIEKRSFQDWTMAFLNLNKIDQPRLSGFSDFLEKSFATKITSEHLTVAEKLMVKFKDYLDKD